MKSILSCIILLAAGLALPVGLLGCKEASTLAAEDPPVDTVAGTDSVPPVVDSVPKDTLPKDTLPKDTLPKDTLPKGASGYGILDPRAASACFEHPPGESLPHVSESEGAINLYFNKSAETGIPGAEGNEANHGVNLERRLLHRLAGARRSIEFATYEINLPRVIQALVDKAAEGVRVRVIADAKAPDDEEHEIRYDIMRGFLEKLIRGADGAPGTADDVALMADSPVLALADTALRLAMGLPRDAGDLPAFAGLVGTKALEGRLVAPGEQKAGGGYYSAPDQMHNKFAVVDGEWVFTGSWNFTVTGLYGDDADYLACGLNGSQQHSIEMRSAEVAAAYQAEFAEMWGGLGDLPDPALADFHGRKADNTPHAFTVGGRKVEVYFSPGDGAVQRLTDMIRADADSGVLFAIYAWSSQALVDALKVKWEGSADSAQGERTGFAVRGLFDASFWNQWWSASIEMTGRVHATASVNNPRAPWKHPAPVCRQGPDSRKLHSKTLIVDEGTGSDPTVVIGSTNWSNNGEDVNDENMVILHDQDLANQARQEFEARWKSSGCRE